MKLGKPRAWYAVLFYGKTVLWGTLSEMGIPLVVLMRDIPSRPSQQQQSLGIWSLGCCDLGAPRATHHPGKPLLHPQIPSSHMKSFFGSKYCSSKFSPILTVKASGFPGAPGKVDRMDIQLVGRERTYFPTGWKMDAVLSPCVPPLAATHPCS